MRLNEVYRNSGLGKWFHGESATKEPGWDRYNSEGKRVGKCGDAKEGSAYSACLSKQKAQKLGKEGRASFVKRKRAAQNEAGRGEKGTGRKGKKPINVDTGASKMEECYECEQEIILEGKNKPNDPEKWSACKSAAKSKFDVYPSAYANAWAAKCYKKKGGSWRSVKEDTQMDKFKSLIKENIIFNFLENAKPEFARRGAGRQRPKSWDKGTKAGSEKRKMREQGKREARELHENKDWIAAAHDAFSGYISPADITVHFQNKNFSSVDQFKAAIKQLADDHADRFISTQARESQNPEAAMQNWSDKIVNKFEHKIAQQAKMKETSPLRGISKKREVTYDDTDAVRDQRAVDEFEGRRGRGSWKDYYDQPGYWRESVEHSLHSRLSETKSWGPEYAGSSQDDVTARAYEDQAREADLGKMSGSHSDMVKKIEAAHKAAISHAFTAATMGKTKLNPEQMIQKYHEHFKHTFGSD